MKLNKLGTDYIRKNNVNKDIIKYIESVHKPLELNLLSISGMVGVGKTTLIKHLCEILSMRGFKVGVMFELHENNEYSMFQERHPNDDTTEGLLKEYYAMIPDLKSDNFWKKQRALTKTFSHQVVFLDNRVGKSIEAVEKAVEENYDYLIFDRTLFADRIFTKLNLEGHPTYMDDYKDIWNTEVNVFQSIMKEHKLKCYNIILDANFDTIAGRIKKRGREMEQGDENLKYFEDLHKNYLFDLKTMFIKAKLTFEIFDVSEKKMPILFDVSEGKDV